MHACAIWSPYYQCNIHQVETVQRRAARYVMNNFNSYASVSEMIATLGWPTLEQRRKTLRTIMMYKIVNNLVEVPILMVSSSHLNYDLEDMLRNFYSHSIASMRTCTLFFHK